MVEKRMRKRQMKGWNILNFEPFILDKILHEGRKLQEILGG
jgi:hypothetical protein